MTYAIIATLGPSTDTAAAWQALLTAGATAFRLNTSHLSLPQLHAWLDTLTPFLAALDPRPPLVLDLQGSKWRLGHFAAFDLVPGHSVELVYAPATDRPGILPVPHLDFFQAAPTASGDLVLNDAKIRLNVRSIAPHAITATVIQGGLISARKGLTYAASNYRHEALNAQDQAIVDQTRHLAGVRYAISYVKDAAEMAHYRSLIGDPAYLIAKLERPPALAEAHHIAAIADELWVCRGDLGAELGLAAMAAAVHRFSDQVADLPVPAIMAGQVLEHMTEQPTPTRSEVCYLHDTLARGYRGFVLSDEVAIGRYPIESCRVAALFKTQ